MSAIYVSGRRFEMQADPIEVSSLSRPNPSWRFTDAAGHEHQWYVDGAPAVGYNLNTHYTLPTLVVVESEPDRCVDCHDEHTDSHYECAICHEHIRPGTTADSTRQYIAGVKRYSIDGRSVSESEFMREVEIEKKRIADNT